MNNRTNKQKISLEAAVSRWVDLTLAHARARRLRTKTVNKSVKKGGGDQYAKNAR